MEVGQLQSSQSVTNNPVTQMQEIVRLMEATAKQQEKLMTQLAKLEKQGDNPTQRPRYNNNNNNNSKLECYYCKKRGHERADCYKKKADDSNKTRDTQKESQLN